MSEVPFDGFIKLDFRIGRVIEAEKIKGSSKLLKLIVNIGDEKRQVIAGIGEYYTPEELKSKLLVFVVNLKSRKVFGEVSEAMLLAAFDETNISLLIPDKDISIGSKIS